MSAQSQQVDARWRKKLWRQFWVWIIGLTAAWICSGAVLVWGLSAWIKAR